MPSKSVRIEGLDELISSFRGPDGIIEREGRSFLHDMGNFGVLQSQKEILNVGAVDTNELVQGMHHDIKSLANGMQVTIRPSDEADKYAWFVEHGSKPHRAPIEALRGWADRHGIPVGAVWHKIATEGTEPRYPFREMFKRFEREVDKEVPRFMDAILRRF